MTLRVLADGAWGVHSTTDLDSSMPKGRNASVSPVRWPLAGPRESPMVELAEVPVITDDVVWTPNGDLRDLDLDAA